METGHDAITSILVFLHRGLLFLWLLWDFRTVLLDRLSRCLFFLDGLFDGLFDGLLGGILDRIGLGKRILSSPPQNNVGSLVPCQQRSSTPMLTAQGLQRTFSPMAYAVELVCVPGMIVMIELSATLRPSTP